MMPAFQAGSHEGVFSMKNTFKKIATIVFAALIGLTLASCLSQGGRKNAGSPGGFGYAHAEWPSNDTWARHGLIGGLQHPPGTVVNEVGTSMGVFFVTLGHANKAAIENLAGQIESRGDWTIYERQSSRREEIVSLVRGYNSVVFSLNVRASTLAIIVTPENK